MAAYNYYVLPGRQETNMEAGRKEDEKTGKMDSGDKDIFCPICLQPPHNAVMLECWTEKNEVDRISKRNEMCKPVLCGTSRRRSNCINKFLSFWGHKNIYPFARWSEHLGGLDFLDKRSEISNWTFAKCMLCRGLIRGAKPAAHRDFYNSLSRKCDFNQENCKFNFQGNQTMIEEHVSMVHAPSLPQEEEEGWEI